MIVTIINHNVKTPVNIHFYCEDTRCSGMIGVNCRSSRENKLFLPCEADEACYSSSFVPDITKNVFSYIIKMPDDNDLQ